MFDMTKIKIKHFNVKFRNGLYLSVEPPKIKVLKRIMSLSTNKLGKKDDKKKDFSAEDFQNLSEALAMALSKNKQQKKITTDFIDEEMNIDEMIDLLTAYFEWVGEVQNSKN